MKSFCLLSPILFIIISIHQIAGNGIRVPLSKYVTGHRVHDQELYGTISIGTPPQKIKVLFDWELGVNHVLSSYCNDSVCRAQNHSTYEHRISETFRSTKYDFDELIVVQTLGAEVTDTITINNIQIPDVPFYVTKSSDLFKSKPYDGIVGLGYHSQILDYCKKIGFQRKVSLYIQDNNTSELMLCGEDETKFRGNLKYFTADYQLFSDSGWNINATMQSVFLRHAEEYASTMEFPSTLFILNPSSSYITGPEKYMEKIYKALNTTISKISNLTKEVDCKNIHTLPNITFRVGNNNFTLTGNDYIKQVTQNDQQVCILRLKSHKYETSNWVLGNVFNRKFYTVFDAETNTIGFAESIHDGSA
ncbi:uncharacterized protein LOC135837804 [Planococcus citri]|uniref:uncharacterized protein LOC135837804 n=1 Tax=Planococcus citri TaxID=170843 RepID=UPI0031F8B783